MKTFYCAIVSLGVFSLMLTAILGYLLGSFPTAYLVVRWNSKIDIRNAGSGNVGTLNSLQVTGSGVVGVAVLIVDVLKGSAAVLLGRFLGPGEFWFGAVGGLAAVAGHNYPLWLRFKGGRGLATTVGVVILFDWLPVALWCLVWAIGFSIWRKVNMGNAFASLLIGLGAVIAPESILRFFVSDQFPVGGFRIFVVGLMILVLMKHGKPVREHLGKRQLNKSIA